LQFRKSLAVSTHVPPQSVGADAGQLFEHEKVPPSGPEPEHTMFVAQAFPQLPQFAAVVSSTQAPLHGVYPSSHANEQVLLTQIGCACATAVVHALPHVWQLFAVLVVSTQEPLHSVGAEVGHVETQEWVPCELAHTGVAPVHARPHPPQLAALE
jgi:hypothetical protein